MFERSTTLISALFVALLSLFLLGASGCQKEKPAATVNGMAVSKEELNKELDKRYGKQTLEDLIIRKLITQSAEKIKTSIADTEIDKKLEDLKKLVPGGQLDSILKERNTTMDDLKNELKLNLLLRKLAANSITDADKKTFYDKNKERLAQVEASHILVKTQAEAQSILKELKGGKDFAELAQKNSLDSQSKVKGGNLGFFSKGMMDAAFEKAAFDTKPGELSGIVKSTFGFHIIKVVAKKSTYDELKENIEDELLGQNNNERVRTFIKSLKDSAKIVYEAPYNNNSKTAQ